MAEMTRITWAHATFNPWRGCTKVSPGCRACYAEALSKRNPAVLGVWGDDGTRVVAAESAWREPLKWDRAAAAAGERRRVFFSLGDPFEDREELTAPLSRLWNLALYSNWLDFLLLTKRPENVVKRLKDVWAYQKAHLLRDGCLSDWIEGVRPPRNIWLGVSAENQEYADRRIPILLDIPAAVRFVSGEPLLGPIDFRKVPGFNRVGLDLSKWWIIVGGESGPNRRPCEVEWIADIARQCRSAGVPVFVKQDAGPRDGMQGRIPDDLWALKQFPAA